MAIKADLNSLQEEERQRAVELVKGAVDDAYRLGATNLAFMSGKDKLPEHRERALGQLIRSIQEICRHARSKGDLEILLEPFDQDTQFRCLIGPSRLAVEVAQEVRKIDPSFGLMVDMSHLPMLRETPAVIAQSKRILRAAWQRV